MQASNDTCIGVESKLRWVQDRALCVRVCLHMHVCVLGYQLLPGPGGTRGHDSHTAGAHLAANHLPSGAGPWGEVPNQVSALDRYVLCMWLDQSLMFNNTEQ